jgi:hypothetical protein
MMRVSFKQLMAQRELLDRGAGILGGLYRFASRNNTLLVAYFVAAVVLVNSMSPALQGVWFFDGHHPGNMLNGALNILHGEPLLSRVQSIYGLFLPYLNALQLYLFGERYLSLWVLPLVAFSGGLAVYYKVFKGFLKPPESLLAVFIILALNQAVLTPWSNYLVFGINALLIWLFSQGVDRLELKSSTLFGIGALLFVSALLRSQSILLYPAFLALLFAYCRNNWVSKAVALSLGLFCPLAIFVLKLAYDGTLQDYYLQTIAIQDRHYFGDKGAIKGVRQVFEVFATGRAPDGLHNPAIGFAPYEALFGQLWLCIFLVNAYIVIEFGFRMLSGAADKDKLRMEVPPSVVAIAMLTSIGPLFSIHNVWDNFRYAMHMAQGIAVVFYCAGRLFGRENSRAAIVTLSLFFFVPLYSLVEMTRASIKHLRFIEKNPPRIQYAKYFEGIALQPRLRDRLIFSEKFFDEYRKKYPDSYIYTSEHTITEALYAIGKFTTYDKTLTNDHFTSTYPLYYPEYRAKFDAAARSRRLIFLTFRKGYDGLKSYDYVQFSENNGLFIFIARERAENFSMP